MGLTFASLHLLELLDEKNPPRRCEVSRRWGYQTRRHMTTRLKAETRTHTYSRALAHETGIRNKGNKEGGTHTPCSMSASSFNNNTHKKKRYPIRSALCARSQLDYTAYYHYYHFYYYYGAITRFYFIRLSYHRCRRRRRRRHCLAHAEQYSHTYILT